MHIYIYIYICVRPATGLAAGSGALACWPAGLRRRTRNPRPPQKNNENNKENDPPTPTKENYYKEANEKQPQPQTSSRLVFLISGGTTCLALLV